MARPDPLTLLWRALPWALCAVLASAWWHAAVDAVERQSVGRELHTARQRIRQQGRQQLRLEDELRQAIAREQAMAARLERHLADLEQARAVREAAMAEARRPMPEGVRLVLKQLHERLAEDGHHGVRILRATGLLRRELLGVEAVLLGPYGVEVEALLADRMELRLDRTHGIAQLVFRGGQRVVDGVEQAMPDDGYPVELAGVDAAAWEAGLPALVQAFGVAPDPAADLAGTGLVAWPVPRRPMPEAERRGWIAALDGVLAGAGEGVRYRVRGLQELLDGEFRGVGLAGYDTDGLLAFRAEARRMAVEVDDAAGTVAAVLWDGVLHRRSGEATIPAEGFRILLPGLDPGRARELMFDVVKSR